MPVYDYRCTECNSTYDVFHKGSEVKEDVVCPVCGSNRNKKLMSVPAIPMGPISSNSGYSDNSSCETGSCCGGSCGLN